MVKENVGMIKAVIDLGTNTFNLLIGEIESKVIEITEGVIKYRLPSQPNGPLRNMAIDNIFMIKYGDGTKEVFNK
jgi:hypothetical protein